MRASSPAQFKSYSIRMIKALKEDLAKIQSEYIARVNANIDEYLASREDVKHMTEEQLREQINFMSQQVLQLRSSDLYISKLASQIDAMREAFEFCDTDMASQCFQKPAEETGTYSEINNQTHFFNIL